MKKVLKGVFLLLLFIVLQGLLFGDTNYFIHVGHSTVFIHMDHLNIVTDPNWNDRDIIIPRDNPPSIPFDQMPPIDVVLVSHGHFDHMDMDSLYNIYKKNRKVKIFLPINLGYLLKGLGITNYQELTENQVLKYSNITIKTYKAKHNGSRYLIDNTQLSLCYLIKGTKTIFFSGDTGYTNMFQKIGEEEKIDVAMLEIQGWRVTSYEKKSVQKTNTPFPEEGTNEYDLSGYTTRHLHPKFTIKAFMELKAKRLLPIHYDAFFTAFHREGDPIEVLKTEAKKKNIADKLILYSIGKKFILK